MPTGRVEDIPDNIRPGRRSELYQADFMSELEEFLKSRQAPHTYWSVEVNKVKELESIHDSKAIRRLDQHLRNVLKERGRSDLTTIRRPLSGDGGTVFVADENTAVELGKTHRRKDRGKTRPKSKVAGR